jgi:hypothetical protein
LRWFLTYCAENAALAKVHALLAAVLRDHPTLILDTSRACQVNPFIHKRGQPHGSGLGRYRWPIERTLRWLLENKRLGLR